jgi:hypothetical protein
MVIPLYNDIYFDFEFSRNYILILGSFRMVEMFLKLSEVNILFKFFYGR